MTTKEFRKLKAGTRVQWREGDNSPQAGLVIDYGHIREGKAPVSGLPIRFVVWGDGQTTDGSDEWALKNVEVTA